MGQACRGHNTGGSSWCSKGLCYHPDRPWQAGQMGGWEPHEVYKGKCKVSHTGSNNSLCQWKRPMGPRGSKTNQKSINMSLPQRQKSIQGCTVRSVNSTLREVMLPIFSGLVKQQCGVLFPSTRQIWRCWKVQQRATKMIKSLEHLSWEETLGDMLSLEQKSLRQ